MTKPTEPNFFTFKANKNGKPAQQPRLRPEEEVKSEKKPVESTPPHHQSHAHTRSQISTDSRPSQLLHQDADTSSRIPYGTQVVELRDPVALARLVEQRMRKRGAKTEKWRFRAGGLRDGGWSEEEGGRSNPCVVPNGTMAVALKEPVPLASFSEVKKRGKEERVKVVARG